MNLVNETAFPAEIYFGPSGERDIGCAVVVKATWDVGEDGLRVALQNPWPILAEELRTPWGAFPAEGPQRKPWVDLIVLAFARPPGGEPVAAMNVSLSVGAFHHQLRVTGRRCWERTATGIRPTEPVPFHSMPLTWANAFGGASKCPTGPVPWPDNPEGKGFVFEPGEADGVELPNVEDPGCLVRDPRDWPKPAGWAPYPVTGGYRLKRMLDERGEIRPGVEAERYATGWAHPDVMTERAATGDPIVVEGVTGRGALRASVPPCPAKAVVEAGAERRPLSFRLDTLIVAAEERRLVARWRAAAILEMRPREERTVRLVRA